MLVSTANNRTQNPTFWFAQNLSYCRDMQLKHLSCFSCMLHSLLVTQLDKARYDEGSQHSGQDEEHNKDVPRLLVKHVREAGQLAVHLVHHRQRLLVLFLRVGHHFCCFRRELPPHKMCRKMSRNFIKNLEPRDLLGLQIALQKLQFNFGGQSLNANEIRKYV